MKTFHISIKKNDQIFHNLHKVPFDLNTISNIVAQAKAYVSSMLASVGAVYDEDNYSWKVYRYDGSKYWTVSISKNWVGE